MDTKNCVKLYKTANNNNLFESSNNVILVNSKQQIKINVVTDVIMVPATKDSFVPDESKNFLCIYASELKQMTDVDNAITETNIVKIP